MNEDFYCNQDDGEYANNRCAEQCEFCKEVERLNNPSKIKQGNGLKLGGYDS